jgi:uncharacterized OB-fold protein
VTPAEIMKNRLNKVAPLVSEGRIAVPYTWSVGETGSRFLAALRDQERITASRCPSCGAVFVPPRKNCGRCFIDIEGEEHLGREGVVNAFTIVRSPFPLHPAAAPFAYALIRLTGATTDLLHIVKDRVEELKTGVRVRARFKDPIERNGTILDIECFEII